MNFNKILKSLFGDKSTRDMKLIQPLVEKVKAVSPKIEQMDNDALRQRDRAGGICRGLDLSDRDKE